MFAAAHLALQGALDAASIEMPYPRQTLYLRDGSRATDALRAEQALGLYNLVVLPGHQAMVKVSSRTDLCYNVKTLIWGEP